MPRPSPRRGPTVPLLLLGVAVFLLLLGLSQSSWVDQGAEAQVVPSPTPGPLHGIAFAKGCDTPTVVGQQYVCGFGVARASRGRRNSRSRCGSGCSS